MKNIKRLGKMGLILLGIVCMGFSFSGCPDPITTSILWSLTFIHFINTILVGCCLYACYKIYRYLKNKNKKDD